MTMRAVSLRSVKSDGRPEYRSTASSDDGVDNKDFNQYIEETCKKFQCPILVVVGREIQREPLPSKGTKQKIESKSKRKSIAQPPAEIPSPQSIEELNPFGEDSIFVTAVYDVLNQLIEIQIAKFNVQPIPRILMQLIGLKVPYTRHLTKFSIRQCRISMYTIYELNNILTLSNITDICLDQCPLKEGNYDILLSDPSSLRSISLARCRINDIVCERIARRLSHLEPAESTLLTLNLSSNNITDAGVKHIGETLRCNRHLRYLNLADNHIGDAGAQYIFEVLKEFALTIEETVDKNRCYVQYLKEKEALFNKYMHIFKENLSTEKPSKKTTIGKIKSNLKRDKVLQQKDSHHSQHRDSRNSHTAEELLIMKARSIALEILGPFNHPFNPSVTTIKNGVTYCIGNFTLCYLNLRYNNLSYLSVQSLVTVVMHQKNYRNEKVCGLMHVLLEGNYMPEECLEYKILKKELARAMNKSTKKTKEIPEKMIPVTR